jgi:hypothetical protein
MSLFMQQNRGSVTDWYCRYVINDALCQDLGMVVYFITYI